MGERVYPERGKRGWCVAWGVALLLLTACAPSFVKPHRETSRIFPYTAFGTFLVKGERGRHRGMWEVKAWDSKHYRLTLYSSVGTLIGCTEVNESLHHPCSKGTKDLGDTKVWKSLPRELFSKLPLLLSGDLQPQGGGEDGFVIEVGKALMRIRMLQYEDQPFPHPIFIQVRFFNKVDSKEILFMRIQVEEVTRKGES